MDLPILYQDKDLVVVHKHSGLLVHKSLIDRHASQFALQIVRDQIGQHVYPVHRLDRPTSGALMFALSREGARHLSEEFAQGKVQKSYLAVVRGSPPLQTTIDYPLREELDAKSDRMAQAHKPAQSAITEVITLATCELPFCVDKFPTTRYSLVKAKPKTGRKHQIRRHLRHLGHPIIGDVNHGSGKHNRFFKQHLDSHRLLLACTELSLTHPRTHKTICIQSPLASEFKSVLQKLGWDEFCV